MEQAKTQTAGCSAWGTARERASVGEALQKREVGSSRVVVEGVDLKDSGVSEGTQRISTVAQVVFEHQNRPGLANGLDCAEQGPKLPALDIEMDETHIGESEGINGGDPGELGMLASKASVSEQRDVRESLKTAKKAMKLKVLKAEETTTKAKMALEKAKMQALKNPSAAATKKVEAAKEALVTAGKQTSAVKEEAAAFDAKEKKKKETNRDGGGSIVVIVITSPFFLFLLLPLLSYLYYLNFIHTPL